MSFGRFLKVIAWIIFSFPLIKLKKCQDTRVWKIWQIQLSKQYVQSYVEKDIKLENIQNLIKLGPLIRP